MTKIAVKTDDFVIGIVVRKQPCLSLAVGAHITVVVNMIAAQIREYCSIKLNTVDPILGERM